MNRGKRQGRGKSGTIPRRKVFVSFHEELDRKWKDRFVNLMDGWIVDFSVRPGDIILGDRPMVDILREIREDHIADATVTVVLIGACTWRRRFVDWEIHASIRCTKANPRTGLIGIVLPCNSEYRKPNKDEHMFPPRLADNLSGNRPFARVYDWPEPFDPSLVAQWINEAYKVRKVRIPKSSRDLFAKNRKGPCSKGWLD